MPCTEHYADELEEELDSALENDFNVEAEDDSPHEVWLMSSQPIQGRMQGHPGVSTKQARQPPEMRNAWKRGPIPGTSVGCTAMEWHIWDQSCISLNKDAMHA